MEVLRESVTLYEYVEMNSVEYHLHGVILDTTMDAKKFRTLFLVELWLTGSDIFFN
jgi:hypothetical protein